MTVFNEPRHDEGFLISEEEFGRSRDTITLKAGSAYQPGSVLIPEISGGNPTGLHILATNALVDATPTAGLVILARFKDATAANTKGAAIVGDAQVKDTELVFGAATVLADLKPGLALNRIVVRQAI
ncbi:head decoration protein [Rhizobium sp. 1399]|uniref:head decoration protein n=1 Tax=Rhizobium sp. 1399 TaxID=2817758 RepID=UPI0028569095|nr:head decoration protein [Rhizobium sp. 1399]MDR6664023.1 hypothetical protein [Rhizobium sp. 1399]